MKYENKRNGNMFELVGEVDPKYNTVFLRNVETGKEQTVTTSTLKRWYKKVEEESVAEPVVEEPEVVKLVITDMDAMVDCSPCPANEETAYAGAGEAPDEDLYWAKLTEEPGMEVDAPDAEHYRTGAEAYLTALGYEWRRDNQGRTIVKQGGKTYAELYFGKRALKINVRQDKAEVLEQYVTGESQVYYRIVHNYYLPVTLGNIPYTNTAVMLDVFGV